MMHGFDAAPPERRIRWVNQALDQLEALGVSDQIHLEDSFNDAAQAIAVGGLSNFWQISDSATRIAIQPLLEGLQDILQVPR